MRRLALAMILLLPGCCTSCGCGAVAPQASGPTPYARCAMMDPPEPHEARVGELTLRIEERDLTIAGLPESFPIAIARGVAPGRDPIAPALDAVEESGARIVILMGSIGDDEERATETISALGALGRPVLVLEGGRDDPSIVAAAIDALEGEARGRVIDVSGLRRVRLGSIVLVPVAGAPAGRYARSDSACGVGEDDLEAIAGELGEAGDERRLLLSWAAPAGVLASMGLEGADAGDPGLAGLAEQIGARGGLHAWPESHAGEILGGHAVAASIAGPALVRADGSAAASGLLVVTIGADGIVADPPAAAP